MLQVLSAMISEIVIKQSVDCSESLQIAVVIAPAVALVLAPNQNI